MKIIYLIPRSGYVTDLRSDTLWGSLCWGIRYLWGPAELTAFLERCANGKPDFVISSAFPFKQHNIERVPFFPNPLILSPDFTNADKSERRDAYRLRKALKNMSLLGYDDFRDALHGKLTAEDLLNRLRDELKRKYDASENDMEYTPRPETIDRNAPVRHDFSTTHNTIDRLRGGTLMVKDGDNDPAGQLFHADDIWWSDPDNESDSSTPNTGLYFLADGHDLSKLQPVLELLRHLGIGADRTTGKGSFDFDIQDYTEKMRALEPSAETSNAMLNLSLLRPKEQELTALQEAEGCIQYMLQRREGYVGGHRARRPKQPRMYFQEGSVFKRLEGHTERFMGGIEEQKLPDLPNPVWDNGFGFMVNLNWKKQ